MSKFNSSISVLGINEVKVQQAILKLLENSLYQKELLGKTSDTLTEQIRRIRQQLATIDFEIDDAKAQEIADKISTAIGDSVREATTAAQTATAKADIASNKADQANADAIELRAALQDIEGTIEEKAAEAASTLIEQTQAAVNGATQAAQAASQSAQNAASTASQAGEAATAATEAVSSMRIVNLSSETVRNTTYAQYRKVATLPAVSARANSVINFWGAMGGITNATLRQIHVAIGNRQSGESFSNIDIEAYYYRASMPYYADIQIYKESNDTFSVYLVGQANSLFRHELSMSYNENVTVVKSDFTTSAPTGTLVWTFYLNARRIPTANELSNYAPANHNHDADYAALGHNHDSDYAAIGHNHNGVYQPAGSYAAANHNHAGVYQPAGSYAAADHNHAGVYQPAGSYAAASHTHSNYSNETYSFAVYNTDFGTGSTAIAMAGLVKDTSATYNVRVLFYNTAATKRTVVANGTSLTLAATVGATTSHQFTISGSGKFTIDNIATSVDVFFTIWR